jgi:hypothetical protein
MKINLLLGNHGDIWSGYRNIDAGTPSSKLSQHPDLFPGLLDDFPEVCANEATEIVALNILDRIAPEYVGRCLLYWVSSLAHGGRLIVSCLDIVEAGIVLARSTGPNDWNPLIYGGRRSAHSMASVVEMLTTAGLQVLTMGWDDSGLFLKVEAVRP